MSEPATADAPPEEAVVAPASRRLEEAASRGAEAAAAAAAAAERTMAAATTAASKGAAAAATVASRSADAASTMASRGAAAAGVALESVRGSLAEASRRIEAERADWDRVAERAALPDVRAEDPIGDLAARLDREADFWRALAIRASRPGAPRAITLVAAALSLVGGAGLVGLGALGSLVGATATAPHLWAAAGGLAVGVALSVAACAWVDQVSRRTAAEALGRATDAERRLARVAAILALRSADATAYKDALARLERT